MHAYCSKHETPTKEHIMMAAVLTDRNWAVVMALLPRSIGYAITGLMFYTPLR
jgi:hypothetical protein